MKAIVTPYDIVTEEYQAKRHVALHMRGVACEEDVRREIAKMSERGTRTVLVTDEQAARVEGLLLPKANQ
jgi:hypothetical protein